MDYNDFLNKYIPSVDTKSAIRETGHVFSDSDRATIIWNSDLTWRERLDDIKDIADHTENVILRTEIWERVAYEQDVLNRFTTNAGGYIYSLRSHEYEPEESMIGYFDSYKLAYEEGCRLDQPFGITKHRLITETSYRKHEIVATAPLYEPEEADIKRDLGWSGNGIACIEYDKAGNIRYCSSNEMSEDQEKRVNSWNNKRFEDKFVVFPEVFHEHEKVRIIRDSCRDDEVVGWISREYGSHEDYIERATNEGSMCDYSDVQYRVDIWDEEYLVWDHIHVNPIYLKRVREEELCNSFDEESGRHVIVGHDMGAALWLQVVDIKESDRIVFDDVTGIGMEISVHESFFDEVLRPIFVGAFDAEMPLNKKRFTYGLDTGRYLTCFEERILEHNFFTYDQMNTILERIDELVKDGAWRIEKAIDGTDAIQLVTLTAHVRHIMEEYPEYSVISVLS